MEQRKLEYEAGLSEAQNNANNIARRILTIEADNERLSFQIKLKDDEVKQSKEKMILIENIKNQEIERQKEAFDNEKREFEAKWINEQLEAEKNQSNAKIRELKSRVSDLENKNTYLTVELERQNSLFKGKIKEVENWREKYNKLETSKFTEIDEVKNQIDILKRSSLVDMILYLSNKLQANVRL